MKVFLNFFTSIILINFVTVTKEDPCSGDVINISPLGKCKSLSDFLGDETLTIKTENLMYLASKDEGKIEIINSESNLIDYKLEIYKLNDSKLQSHNMRKSKLYIPKSCLDQMKNDAKIKLDEDKGIVILIYDYKNKNQNNLADKYFIIRHNSEGSTATLINSKTFDLSMCYKDPILFEDKENINDIKYNRFEANPRSLDLNTILYGRKFGIDLFDPYSDFLNDICFKFTSEKGTDVTMDSRLEDYYQNISFCDDYENSHYLAYNYSAKDKEITYRCAFGYYKSEADKSGYLDIIDTELKSLVSVSNIKVITCYRKFLNLRDIISNYGGMICILVLIIQIICFLIFCFSGIKPIEDKLENLFVLGASILKSLMKMVTLNTEKDNLIDGQPRKKFNLWGTIRKIIQKKKEKVLPLYEGGRKRPGYPGRNQTDPGLYPRDMAVHSCLCAVRGQEPVRHVKTGDRNGIPDRLLLHLFQHGAGADPVHPAPVCFRRKCGRIGYWQKSKEGTAEQEVDHGSVCTHSAGVRSGEFP